MIEQLAVSFNDKPNQFLFQLNESQKLIFSQDY